MSDLKAPTKQKKWRKIFRERKFSLFLPKEERESESEGKWKNEGRGNEKSVRGRRERRGEEFGILIFF